MSAACARCETLLEPGDLRCSVCALAVPAAAQGSRAPAARILRCSECAAAVSYTIEAQAPRCAFCDAVMKVEQPVDPVEHAQWMLPFGVDREHARAALAHWMRSQGWFRPKDLASQATIDTLQPLHWAAWIFDAEALVTWTADSNMGTRRSDWAPHAGTARFTWNNIVVSASRGLTVREAGQLTPAYDLGTARAPEAAATVESFDVQRSAARKTIVEAIENIAQAQLEHGHIPGSKFRKVKVGVLLSRLVTRRVALPAWVLAYRYRKRLYRAIIHGQDPRLAFGQVPMSWAKVLFVVAASVAAAALLLLLVILALR